MLKKLILDGVGPADRLAFEPVAPRLNLIAGDNGLGKSFLLETAWWALTRTWHESAAVPHRPKASIFFSFDGDKSVVNTVSAWSPENGDWRRAAGRPPNPGLILYARVDGSFSVWDPARNYKLYARADGTRSESPAAYQFSASDVLNGLKRRVVAGAQEVEQTLCLGLIDEWRDWQRSRDPRFDILKSLLAAIGPDNDPLVPGELVRPYGDDVRLIPTIRMPYGQDVPLVYAPAGVRRMCMLAYLLTWALTEHDEAVKRLHLPASKQVVLLIDEPETHLHPRWQRTILPSLLGAVRAGLGARDAGIQMLVATHSPLVLASAEPAFDPAQDALWKLDLSGTSVTIERDHWQPRGDVSDWLTSDVFDLGQARSRDAELAIAAAMAAVREQITSKTTLRQITEELRRVLSDTDRTWVRWAIYARDHGVDA